MLLSFSCYYYYYGNETMLFMLLWQWDYAFHAITTIMAMRLCFSCYYYYHGNETMLFVLLLLLWQWDFEPTVALLNLIEPYRYLYDQIFDFTWNSWNHFQHHWNLFVLSSAHKKSDVCIRVAKYDVGPTALAAPNDLAHLVQFAALNWFKCCCSAVLDTRIRFDAWEERCLSPVLLKVQMHLNNHVYQ